jgi:hypothetical protein
MATGNDEFEATWSRYVDKLEEWRKRSRELSDEKNARRENALREARLHEGRTAQQRLAGTRETLQRTLAESRRLTAGTP